MTEMQSFTESLYGENYLEHHGIKGMKWGVRRTPEQLGNKRRSRKQVKQEAIEKGRSIGKDVSSKYSKLLGESNRHSDNWFEVQFQTQIKDVLSENGYEYTSRGRTSTVSYVTFEKKVNGTTYRFIADSNGVVDVFSVR